MNNKVYMLSKKFREAIEVAKEEGLLDSDPTLKNFPRGCRIGTSIAKRPKEVKNRETFGHWELDTVVSSRGKK